MAQVPDNTPSLLRRVDVAGMQPLDAERDDEETAGSASPLERQAAPATADTSRDERAAGDEADAASRPGGWRGGGRAIGAMWTDTVSYLRKPANGRYVVVFAISLIALLMSLLNFGLITGKVRVPTPGLQSKPTAMADTSTYNFEFDSDGWLARGATSGAVWNNIHTFAGQGALEIQAQQLTDKRNAFIYITAPPAVKPGSTIIAHLYTPTGSPPIVATIYALDGTWAWTAGAYPTLQPGTWTAVRYKIPTTVQGPIREMGVMLVGVAGSAPYTGPIYLDAVNVTQ